MSHSYQRGDEAPKSIAFNQKFAVTRKERAIAKGTKIIIEGQLFEITSIKRVELHGHHVNVLGKCKPLEGN